MIFSKELFNLICIIGTTFFTVSVLLFTLLSYKRFKRRTLISYTWVLFSLLGVLISQILDVFSTTYDFRIFTIKLFLSFAFTVSISVSFLLKELSKRIGKLIFNISIIYVSTVLFYIFFEPILINKSILFLTDYPVDITSLFVSNIPMPFERIKMLAVMILIIPLTVTIYLIYYFFKHSLSRQFIYPMLIGIILIDITIATETMIYSKTITFNFSFLWLGTLGFAFISMYSSINTLLMLYRTHKDISFDLVQELEQNISQLKVSREQIKKEKEHWENLITNAGDAIIVINDDFKIISWNKMAENVTGYTAEEVLDHNIDDVFANSNYKWKLNANNLFLGIPISNVEDEMVIKDGRTIIIEYTATPVYTSKQVIIAASFIVRDITDKKKMSQELINKTKELERLNAVKDNFILSISHELRTPLNSILGFTQLITLELETKNEKQLLLFANRIYYNGQHLLRMINNMIDLSKIHSGAVDLEIEKIDYYDLKEYILTIFSPYLFSKPVELSIEIGSDCKNIYSDKLKIKQIITNLLSNSIKFTSQGFIKVLFNCTDNELLIKVQDSGIGIKYDDQQVIFDKFMQIDPFISKSYGGIGIGLTLTKELVKILEGDIRLESTPGVGTTFYVSLPDFKKN